MWCRSTWAIFGHNYYYLVHYYMGLDHSSSCLYTWRARCVFWLEWPSTLQCTIQKIPFGISRIRWNCPPGVSLRGEYIYFIVLLFFPARFFSLAQFIYQIFFWAHPWPQVFFWEAPTYPNPPTTFFLSTHRLPSSCWPLPIHLLLRSLPSPELLT
jgi:hypothetical protein